MLEKNIKYYRLKNNMTKKALADKMGVTPMAISNYENGSRQPNMDTLKAMAGALGVKVTDFLSNRTRNLQFEHGKFRKGSKLGSANQEYVREAVEEYFGRFFQIVEILGGIDLLGNAPEVYSLDWSDNYEEDAKRLREYLGLPLTGPINNLVEILENKGILVCFIEMDSQYFSGMNGRVNGFPYIVINNSMSTARIRSTIVHEVAHFAFKWPENLTDKDEEYIATAISGAFLFPKEDVYRELGYHRTLISRAMTITCKEYGISMYMLVKRARLCEIINDSVEKTFYINASKAGWRKNEPDWGYAPEKPGLFKQLVYRAVTEAEISIQKGAELLKTSYDSVAEACFI